MGVGKREIRQSGDTGLYRARPVERIESVVVPRGRIRGQGLETKVVEAVIQRADDIGPGPPLFPGHTVEGVKLERPAAAIAVGENDTVTGGIVIVNALMSQCVLFLLQTIVPVVNEVRYVANGVRNLGAVSVGIICKQCHATFRIRDFDLAVGVVVFRASHMAQRICHCFLQ